MVSCLLFILNFEDLACQSKLGQLFNKHIKVLSRSNRIVKSKCLSLFETVAYWVCLHTYARKWVPSLKLKLSFHSCKVEVPWLFYFALHTFDGTFRVTFEIGSPRKLTKSLTLSNGQESGYSWWRRSRCRSLDSCSSRVLWCSTKEYWEIKRGTLKKRRGAIREREEKLSSLGLGDTLFH